VIRCCWNTQSTVRSASRFWEQPTWGARSSQHGWRGGKLFAFPSLFDGARDTLGARFLGSDASRPRAGGSASPYLAQTGLSAPLRIVSAGGRARPPSGMHIGLQNGVLRRAGRRAPAGTFLPWSRAGLRFAGPRVGPNGSTTRPACLVLGIAIPVLPASSPGSPVFGTVELFGRGRSLFPPAASLWGLTPVRSNRERAAAGPKAGRRIPQA
jgi:hypothetical protein